MKDDRYYLELAMAEAETAFKKGSIPIGAVIVGPDGEIVSIHRPGHSFGRAYEDLRYADGERI